MICEKCNGQGVKNQVLGKEFFYCRTCKTEIGLVIKVPELKNITDFSGLSNWGYLVLNKVPPNVLYDLIPKTPSVQGNIPNHVCVPIALTTGFGLFTIPKGKPNPANLYNGLETGLNYFIPIAEPPITDSFLGANRYHFPEHFAGIRLDARVTTVYDGISNLLSRINGEGYRASHVFINPNTMRELEIELNRKVFPNNTLEIHTPVGRTTIYEDYNCTPRLGYALTLSTWQLDEDFGQMWTNLPISNGVVLLSH